MNAFVAVGVGEVFVSATVLDFGPDREEALRAANNLNAGFDVYVGQFEPLHASVGPWCVARACDVTSGRDLPADVAEVLTCAAEECAEVTQVCTKILRFGSRVNPWTGVHGSNQLEQELGDVMAFMLLLGPDGGLANGEGIISLERVFEAANAKLDSLSAPDARLRHYTVPQGVCK